MFSEKLEKLIQSSLQDGVLTDQEKAVILKRAKVEGEDIDEVEIYIDSLLQKRQKELNNTSVKKQANASNMNELKKLIDAAMTDGVLTDKERQVILKKAEGMGLDRDEIDLYLDAEVQKVDQQTDAAVRKQKGKTCPYCGGSVPQLTDKCPHCGENITAQASEELQEMFDNLEEALIDLKSGKDFLRSKATVERYSRKAKMYYGSNPKIQKLLQEVENEMFEAEKKAKSTQRKDAFLSFIKSKWMRTLTILLIGVITVFGGLQKCESYYEYCSDTLYEGGFIVLIGIGFIVAAVVLFIKDISSKK